MEKFLGILKHYWVFAIVAIVGITLTFTLSFIFSKKEVKEWAFDKHYAKKCPYLGSYPLYWKSYLPRRYLSDVQRAAFEINIEVKKKLKFEGMIYKQLKGEPKPGQFFIEVKDAPSSLYAFKKLCEPFKLGDSGDVVTPGHVAELTVKWQGDKPISAEILVCIKKIEDGMELMETPVAEKLKRFGVKVPVKHEFVHGVIGPKHPAWGGELMLSAPSTPFISDHVLRIIGLQVLPICRKNGLLGL